MFLIDDWIKDFINDIKCNHEYELINRQTGFNGWGMYVTKETYRCKHCLKHKTIIYDADIDDWD